ncbi:peptide ABC transporter substrate-binding protein [Lysinibacillus sp. NPDC094177]|uniref:peptide ABC transporter substrate-binding protein n=1 Tax=Lysinibacillus sp. NPDC094177 TaxID=3390580 RepID=UPI003D06D6B4
MTKKTKWLVVLLGLMLVVLVGCYGKEDNSSSSPTGGNSTDKESTTDGDKAVGQELHLVAGGDLATMSSLGSVDALAVTAMNSVFEGLYRIGPENTPVPGMAESYEASEDGTVYTFKLRQDAMWSNGTPVTAHDFEYAWKRAINPKTQAIYSYLMLDIKNAASVQKEGDPLYGKVDEIGIKALNDHTLEVQLNAPIPYFLSLTTYAPFFPLNKEFTEAQGDQYALEAANMIYNGPFVMESWQHGQGWTFVKNGEYWDKNSVKLTKITQKIVKDTATAVNLYEAGEIDTAELSSEYVAQYKDSPEYSTFLKPNTYFIRMNHENKVLSNKNIRKAIDMAWDKQGFADVILQDGSIPAYYLVPLGLSTDEKGVDFREGNGDMNKTNVELAKEAWATGLKELGVDKVKLEFLTYDRAESKKAAEFIKNQLETNLEGLELTINMQPNKQKLALEGAVDYDLDYGGWGPDYQDPMTYIELFESTAYYNQSHYKNEKVDALIKKAKTTSDVSERWLLMQQAEKIMMDDFAFAPTFQKGISRLTKPYVKNLYEHPFSADISYKWVEIVK